MFIDKKRKIIISKHVSFEHLLKTFKASYNKYLKKKEKRNLDFNACFTMKLLSK